MSIHIKNISHVIKAYCTFSRTFHTLFYIYKQVQTLWASLVISKSVSQKENFGQTTKLNILWIQHHLFVYGPPTNDRSWFYKQYDFSATSFSFFRVITLYHCYWIQVSMVPWVHCTSLPGAWYSYVLGDYQQQVSNQLLLMSMPIPNS